MIRVLSSWQIMPQTTLIWMGDVNITVTIDGFALAILAGLLALLVGVLWIMIRKLL